MDVETVVLPGRDTPALLFHETACSAVDCLSVFFQPLSHSLQPLCSLFRDCAVRSWTDVQKQVGVVRRRLHEKPDEICHTLVGFVPHLVAPIPVHRHACLQRQGFRHH